jgi:hypothetical protein
MSINPYLDGHQFDAETKRIMDIAFEMTRALAPEVRPWAKSNPRPSVRQRGPKATTRIAAWAATPCLLRARPITAGMSRTPRPPRRRPLVRVKGNPALPFVGGGRGSGPPDRGLGGLGGCQEGPCV